MCVHEILAKKGFDQKWFLPKHMRRKRVSGSTTGWTRPADTNMATIMSNEASSITNPAADHSCVTSQDHADADGGVFLTTQDDNTHTLIGGADDARDMPRDHLPETNSTTPSNPMGDMRPFDKKRIQLAFTNVLNMYMKCSNNDQYLVSRSVMDLEAIINRRSSAASTEHQLDGSFARAKAKHTLRSEPKKRLRSRRDIEQEASEGRKKKHCYRVEVDGLTAVVNQKKRGSTCAFCGGSHKHTTCEKKSET